MISTEKVYRYLVQKVEIVIRIIAMAAPMEKCARVKLFFKNGKIEPSWLFVRASQLPCVADIEKHIKRRFDIDCSDVKLYLSGCFLPKWESTELLQDNDAVDVVMYEISNVHYIRLEIYLERVSVVYNKSLYRGNFWVGKRIIYIYIYILG